MKMLDIIDVANMLHMSKNTVYNLVRQNEFPKIRIGRKILIPEEELDKYIKKHIGDNILVD